ncbi:MAG: IclR family transcriptional regulator [Azospirillaceae bacterium]
MIPLATGLSKADKAADRRGIQSIEVGFKLIEVLEREGRKLPLKTIAQEAGMPPSKAHLYLVSFSRLGLVIQDPVTTRYSLGPYAIQLGVAAINQLDLVDVAREHMEWLQETTGVSVSLSIWGNKGPTIIQKIDGPMPLPLAIRVGFVLPLLTSATGRIFLSFLPEREWRDIAGQEGILRPAALGKVDEVRETVRRARIASSDSEVNEGFAALSAPIFDHDGQLLAAITILGLRSMVESRPEGAMAGSLREAAHTISRSLGGIEDTPRAAGGRTDRVRAAGQPA